MIKYLTQIAAAITDPCLEGYVGSGECPRASNTDILGLVNDVVGWFSIAIGILAVIFIIISGIQLTTSRGNSDKVKRAQRTLLYSVIGLAVAILANVIISIVVNTAGSLF